MSRYRAKFSGYIPNPSQCQLAWSWSPTLEVRQIGSPRRGKWQVFCEGSAIPFPSAESPIVAYSSEFARRLAASWFRTQVTPWEEIHA